MLNEGIVKPDTRQLMKTEMIRELHELGSATPLRWQHAVFKRCTGEEFTELDWEFEDNKAGAFLWTKSFDELIQELVVDGFVRKAEHEEPVRRSGPLLCSRSTADVRGAVAIVLFRLRSRGRSRSPLANDQSIWFRLRPGPLAKEDSHAPRRPPRAAL
jgi:hypothetical protein